jgi:hypothetical protein
MKWQTRDSLVPQARVEQTLADCRSASRGIQCIIDHHEVCCAPVAIRMQRKRWLCHRMKKLL